MHLSGIFVNLNEIRLTTGVNWYCWKAYALRQKPLQPSPRGPGLDPPNTGGNSHLPIFKKSQLTLFLITMFQCFELARKDEFQYT
jgi:hypothetical protein